MWGCGLRLCLRYHGPCGQSAPASQYHDGDGGDVDDDDEQEDEYNNKKTAKSKEMESTIGSAYGNE